MIARFLTLLILAYQRIVSPLLGPTCRFSPSCSQYTLLCIERFGALRGSWLGVKRIARCHPFHPGGVDLPPEIPTCCAYASELSLPARSLDQSP